MSDILFMLTVAAVAFVLGWQIVVSVAAFWRYRLRAKVRGWWFDYTCPEAKASEGICCCGSPIDQHGWGDGHSPVDMYHYHKDAYVSRT